MVESTVAKTLKVARPRVLFVATTASKAATEGHAGWQASVREALFGPLGAAPDNAEQSGERPCASLDVDFLLVATAEELEQTLRSGAYDYLHCYEHDSQLITDAKGGRPNLLQVVNRLGAHHAEAMGLRAVVLTETSARSGTPTEPVPGVLVTVMTRGSLERGPALAFTGAYYRALAQGLTLNSCVEEGANAAREIHADVPFEVALFEAGERVHVNPRPYEELRRLERVAREITTSIRAVQRQLSLSSKLRTRDLLGDRFVLETRVASGRFTEVWTAYDRERRELMAVKVLHEAWAKEPEHQRRFNRSAIAMAELDHPHVARLLTPVHRDGRCFYAMRWYANQDMGRALERGLIHRDAALRVCADAFEGLAAAHERGIVHRDVQPGHLLVDQRGRGFIADFDPGVDQPLRAAPCSPYAAPELRVQLDARADVYAAAMCALHVLLGEQPRAGASMELIDSLNDCNDELRTVLRESLQPDPRQRTATCAALAQALRRFASMAPDLRPRPDWTERGTDHAGHWASVTVGEVELRMRRIEAGSFSMGGVSPDMSHKFEGWHPPGPEHTVRLSRGFWLAEAECTQALWEAVMGDNPSHHVGPTLPVEKVSFVRVQRFIAKLNERVGGPAFCLPTEAQWEYACRASTQGPTYAGHGRALGEIAWYALNARNTQAVGTKQPNPWGLHDTLGNVWEWCGDGPRTYGFDAVVDPVGGGALRVVRGGGWHSSARFGLRASDRLALPQATANERLGFRLARYLG